MVCVLFCACSKEQGEVESSPIAPKEPIPLVLENENESLDSLMDKIISANAYEPSNDALLESIAKESITKASKPKDNFPPVSAKRYEIAQLLKEAYQQNKSHDIKPETLDRAFALRSEWNVLSEIADSYQDMSILEHYDTQIALELSLLLLNSARGDISSINNLLLGRYESARGSGELNVIIESRIQVRLLMLNGLHHLDMINGEADLLTNRAVREALIADLHEYKDFLAKAHYAVYKRAYDLLSVETISEEAPMDRILDKLISYWQSAEVPLNDDGTLYKHIERIKEAYKLSKTKDFKSQNATQIIQIAKNPTKNVYANATITNYLYGLSYLTLALLNDDINVHLDLALESLQKDFKDLQIMQHRFDMPSFHNYMSAMFFNAYVLGNVKENLERFEELLKIIKADLAQYSDVISKADMDLYEDALSLLEQTDRGAFLAINFTNSAPKEEAGYKKVHLILSPQELEHIKHITNKESSVQNGESVCLNTEEVAFMLSLTYQAYKASGFKGVAPEMFKIRLGEVFYIDLANNQSSLGKHLIDFEAFKLLGVANKSCYKDEDVQERLNDITQKGRICGYNLYFDKQNGFVTDEILPSLVLEQDSSGNFYYRVKEIDLHLNSFIFHNDENALNALKSSPNHSQMLYALLAFFSDMKSYLHSRLSPQEAQNLIAKAKMKACK